MLRQPVEAMAKLREVVPLLPASLRSCLIRCINFNLHWKNNGMAIERILATIKPTQWDGARGEICRITRPDFILSINRVSTRREPRDFDACIARGLFGIGLFLRRLRN